MLTSRFQRSARALAAGFISCLLCVVLEAAAAAGTKKFNVPADAADKALSQFSAQAGVQVVFPTDLVQGVRTNAVQGTFAPREALEKMVAGTPLVVFADERTGALGIRRDASAEDAAKNDASRPAADRAARSRGNANSTANDESVTVLQSMEVTSSRDEGYRSTQTVSGSRTVEALRDTPTSISILNRELMDDLNVSNINEMAAFGVVGEHADNNESASASYVFRGQVALITLRNGVPWLQWVDSHSVERMEVLRGPQAFMYGEASPAGVMNIVTKQAIARDFQKLTLMAGPDNLRRVELDVNRKIHDNLAARVSLAHHTNDSYIHHAKRNFRGVYLAVNYRPFRQTTIAISGEHGRNHLVQPTNLLADQFSSGATGTYTAAIGGMTFVPATGEMFKPVGQQRSGGNGIAFTDTSILPKEYNFVGPNNVYNFRYNAINLTAEQRFGRNLLVTFSGALTTNVRNLLQKVGSSSGGVYRDTNRTRPNGSSNPYFNELYTQYQLRSQTFSQPVRDARLTAVYDWKFRFMTQRLVGFGVWNEKSPNQYFFAEHIDPRSPNFTGTLNPASTVAAANANNTALANNAFYRRFYLKDGDGAHLTGGEPIAGTSLILRNATNNRLADRKFWTPAYGAGSSGSYFKGRLRTLIGWRHDEFQQNLGNDYFNWVTGEFFRVATPRRTVVEHDSVNYGGVVHLHKTVSAYFNYAESISLSSGTGGVSLIPGELTGSSLGSGNEYGLRFALFGGRLESNLNYFITDTENSAVNPALTAAVRSELGAVFPASEVAATSGTDTQVLRSTGFEFETVANLTTSWRLIWNMAFNEVETSDRYPRLLGVRELAKSRGFATPQTDAFLAQNPEGTPIPGFIKVRSNLVTTYRFNDGALKGFNVGGGFQYRGESYRGNFDLNRDGVAEQLWAPKYMVWNLILGYRTKLFDRNVNVSLNVNNLLDKDYFRSTSLGSGVWGEPRTFRFAIRTDL